jgi:uncharacterized membrane-anchored protein
MARSRSYVRPVSATLVGLVVAVSWYLVGLLVAYLVKGVSADWFGLVGIVGGVLLGLTLFLFHPSEQE